jgi:hypothetical protein
VDFANSSSSDQTDIHAPLLLDIRTSSSVRNERVPANATPVARVPSSTVNLLTPATLARHETSFPCKRLHCATTMLKPPDRFVKPIFNREDRKTNPQLSHSFFVVLPRHVHYTSVI